MARRLLVILWLFIIARSALSALPEAPPANPVLPGADPHVIVVGNIVWLYPTHYGEQQAQLYAYASTNLQDWERHGPVLKIEDISWIADDGADTHYLWAPAVAEHHGRYYLYFSVGPQHATPSRIGVAVGDGPAGPFHDSGRPLLTGGDGFEAIDPMVFTDPETGTAFFYAGGSAGARLRVFEMNPDRVSFAREVPVETPPHFTEAPFMHERNGVYYLSYSHGAWWNASYSAHYATSDSPTGPWNYRGVLLKSDTNHKGPGHHAFLRHPDQDLWFVVYHRWNHQRGLGPFNAARQVAIDLASYDDDGLIEPIAMTAGNTAIATPPAVLPPGVAINHVPQATGLFIGSPSITVLPNGDYLAAHDFFGPESKEHECATAVIHRSGDRGESWREIARLQCLFWPKLFTHRNAAYIIGVEKHHGRIVIRRSTDNGETWTSPRDSASGLLTPDGEYHTAPMPVLEHAGRLWRAFEDAMGGDRWGERYRAGMLSIPVDADLLQASNWTFSNFIARDPVWLDGDFNGWLEGNAVLDRDGHMVNMLRVDTPTYPEKAAIVAISEDGETASFDPETGFIDFPGGAKKFTVRYDAQSDRYWTLATVALPQYGGTDRPARIRNTLALMRSDELRDWETQCIVLHHPDVAAHGFQYVDWTFDGDDLIAVCRTAHDDGIGGARNNHDANFMTFHRIRNFRALTPADSVPVADPVERDG